MPVPLRTRIDISLLSTGSGVGVGVGDSLSSLSIGVSSCSSGSSCGDREKKKAPAAKTTMRIGSITSHFFLDFFLMVGGWASKVCPPEAGCCGVSCISVFRFSKGSITCSIGQWLESKLMGLFCQPFLEGC